MCSKEERVVGTISIYLLLQYAVEGRRARDRTGWWAATECVWGGERVGKHAEKLMNSMSSGAMSTDSGARLILV